jgi:hypothetical protein
VEFHDDDETLLTSHALLDFGANATEIFATTTK